VFLVRYVSDLCDELNTLSEETYQMCVSNCVIYKLQKCGGLDPSWVVAPQKENCMSVVAEMQSKSFHIQRMLIVKVKISCDMCFRTTP